MTNFSWLLAERGWRLVLGLVVSVVVARHLGPGDFGLLSYALGFNAIFWALGGLGIDDVLARELVRNRATAPVLLAVGLRLKAWGAAGAFISLLGFAWWWRPGDPTAWIVVALAGSGLWFLPMDAVDVWFQAQERMRLPVLARQIALLGAALLRLGLVWFGAPLWIFALAVMLEALFIAAALAWVLRQDGVRLNWQAVEPHSGITLLREGWPLLASGVLVVISMQADRLLLVRLAGDSVAGVYAAAARFTEVLYALPVALGAVLLPRLTGLKAEDEAAYWRTARQVAGGILLLALLVATGLTLGGRAVLPELLGEGYRESGAVLAVHGWTFVFVSLVSLRSRLLVIEGRSQWILLMSAGTMMINVGGNLWLIPRYGAVGAAWAAVLAWGCSALILPWLWVGPRRFMSVWCGLAKGPLT